LLEVDYWELTPLHYQEQEQLQLDMLLTKGYYGPYEKEYIQKDGKRIPVRLNGVITTNSNGEKYIWSIIEDISARKRSEADLSESSERFSYLVNSIPQLVWTATEDGQLLFANEKLFNFVGASNGDLTRLRHAMLKALSPASAKAFKRAWYLANKVQQPEFNLELQVMRQDGEYRWLELHAVSIISQNGRQTRWVGTLTDVSERRMADQTLRESQKLEAIGSLTGGLAHDFNNLLGIVLGNLDMLNTANLEPKAAAQVRVALAAAERGAELTKSLLAVARGQTSSAVKTSLNDLLKQMEPLLVPTAGVRIKLRLKIEMVQAMALVDVGGMESSLLNLVINARDAMAHGGAITIALRAPSKLEATDLPPGDYATVEVIDTGIGMSAEVLGKATNPFFTTKERGRGTGLGLAMVNSFAHQSGGSLRIASKLGAGTSVQLTLPLLGECYQTIRPAEVKEGVSGHHLGKVMVVDDEQPLLDLLVTWLTQAGYSVQCFNSGEVAWRALQNQPPDILITDVVMPGKLDGLGLAARTEQLGAGVRILLVSGFPIDGQEAVAASNWPLMAKPYRREELLRKVVELGGN
jgi:PAS domain S-box-containing protein